MNSLRVEIAVPFGWLGFHTYSIGAVRMSSHLRLSVMRITTNRCDFWWDSGAGLVSVVCRIEKSGKY